MDVPIVPVLAQLGELFAPEITPLPEPPAVESLLLEGGLLLPAMLAGLGVILFFGLRGRGSGRSGGIALLACLVLAVGTWLVAQAVETEREILTRQTRELVDAAVAIDTDRLAELLHDDLRATAPRFGADLDKSTLVAGDRLRGWIERAYRVTDHGIEEVQASVDGANVGRTQVSVWVDSAAVGRGGSWWKLDWYKNPDGSWQVMRITPLWYRGM